METLVRNSILLSMRRDSYAPCLGVSKTVIAEVRREAVSRIT